MQKSWTSSQGHDLFLDLRLDHGRRAGLEDALRNAVWAGRLAAGTRLPSSRALARDLGLARGTVVEAYEQLIAEGYLTALRGGGTNVSAGAHAGLVTPAPRARLTRAAALVPGAPDLSSFPRRRWLAGLRRALASAPDRALDYGDPRGQLELRETLAHYLGRTRGVVASPDRLVICSGFIQAWAVLCRALRLAGASAVAVEDPGNRLYRAMAEADGLRIVDLPVDGEGAEPAVLAHEDAAAVLVTPAHQMPMGVTMSGARRAALLRWARAGEGIVVEDDYDGEFRFDQMPVGALQGLDQEHVAHVGSASKTLAPGLRLAWLTVPPRLLDTVVEAKMAADWATGVLDQLAFKELVESGDYDRHVRRMRRSYRQRRDLLISTLADRVPAVRVVGVAAGVHAVVELPSAGPSEEDVISLGRRRSLPVMGLGAFRHTPQAADQQAIVVGYGRPPHHSYRQEVERLADLLAEACA
jgi:GntR family transcriptional regulator/MocR family aminotransferase